MRIMLTVAQAGFWGGLTIALGLIFTGLKTEAEPTMARTPTVLSRTVQPASLPMLDQSVLQQINQYRASRKLPPLRLDSRITAQARAHSQAMAERSVPFGHDGFQQRVQAIARVIPYRQAAENVAYNQGYSDPAQQAVQGWLKSSGHRQNIEGLFDLTGIGIAQNVKGEYYLTKI